VRELLVETVTEYYVAYNLLRNKNALLTSYLPEIYLSAAVAAPLPMDDDDEFGSDASTAVSKNNLPIVDDFNMLQLIVDQLITSFPNETDYDQANTDVKNTYKDHLQNYRKKIGELKQVLDSLEYYDATFATLRPREQTELYMKYIDKQIKHAISVSIPPPLFTQIKAFNGVADEMGVIKGGGINNVKDITKALSNMYDNYDFYSRIFDLHDIACEAFKEKIQKYSDIIMNSPLSVDIKNVIIAHYKVLQDGITAINDKFTEEAKTKLTDLIKKRENPPYSARERKGPGQSMSATAKTELETEQALLMKKKNECTELTQKISKLADDLLKAQENEKQFKSDLEAKKNEIKAAEAARKKLDKKDKAAIADAKALEEQLKGEKDDIQDKLNTEKAIKISLEKEEKSQKAEKDRRNTFVADLLSKITKLENKLILSVQNEMAKVHTKGTDTLKQISNWFSSKFQAGGRNKKTRQNKQKYKKKYTKRYNKKTYRKRSQKHHKIKRHKYTKKR
jgi:hypothetical protein